jgi:PKD repeat protein
MPQNTPKNWTLNASNSTSGPWTTLDTQTQITWTTSPKSFPVTNTAAFSVYNITVSASGSGGDAVSIGELILYETVPESPHASFTVNATTGISPLAVGFTDTSTNTPTAWNWSYMNTTPGNNTPVYWSTTQNPSQVFGDGNWLISLNASNSVGYNLSAQTTWINVTNGEGAIPPLAMFTQNFWVVLFPRPVQFNDTSTNTPTAWNWSFGDGKYSDVQNATHQYVKRGRWTVLLNASNTAGYSTNTSTVWILGG